MQKKKTIEQRVVSLVLWMSFAAIILTSAVSCLGMFQIMRETTAVSQDMGQQAAEGSRQALENMTAEEVSLVAMNKTKNLEIIFSSYESTLSMLSGYVGNIYDSPEMYKAQPYLTISDADSISPIAHIAFSSDADEEALAEEAALLANAGGFLMSTSSSDSIIMDIYFGTESGILAMSSNVQRRGAVEDYDYKTREWYALAKKEGKFTISQVYDDAFGRGEIISLSKPIYSSNSGEFLGVVGINIQTEQFRKLLEADDITKCQFMIIAQNEDIIIANDYRIEESGETIADIAAKGSDRGYEIRKNIQDKDFGTELISLNNRQIYIAHSKLPDYGWIVITYVEMDEAVAPAEMIKSDILRLSDISVMEVTKYILVVIILILMVLVIAMISTYIFGRAFARRIVSPLSTLTENVKKISHGDLKFECDIKTNDEIQDLADAFRNMTDELGEHINKVKSELKEKEKHKAELDIAKKIQMSILPTDFVDFSNAMEFEVSATIRPAKGVGGDFYDYFMIDDERLAVVIADVSGKGVPAALFMMIAKMLINSHAKSGTSTGDIFNEVNNRLCLNNEAGMFVTAFIGILNIKTGVFEYSNAGHTPPLIYRYKKGFEWLPVTKNLFLAGMEDTEYSTDTITLGKGDIVLLYTDGVTEATDRSKKQYSKERLFSTVNTFSAEHMTLDEIIAHITESIGEFTLGAEQADDVTMLIIRYFSES